MNDIYQNVPTTPFSESLTAELCWDNITWYLAKIQKIIILNNHIIILFYNHFCCSLTAILIIIHN